MLKRPSIKRLTAILRPRPASPVAAAPQPHSPAAVSGDASPAGSRRPNTTIITASPGDRVIINDTAAITVGVTTLQVVGLCGTDIVHFGREVRLINDGVQSLPALADMQDSFLAKASRQGKPAARRLRESFNGILATDSEARASTVMLWGKPQFIDRSGGVQELEPDAVIGTVFWKVDGQYMHSEFTATGALSPAASYRPEQ